MRVVESHARTYRHTWKGSAFSTFLSPVLFLAAMGLGLGTLVDRGAGIEGVDYLAFLAPGLLAATAMQTGAGDSAWPVMAGMKWVKTYHAALATPIGPRDLVHGHLLWLGVRLILTTVVYAAVIALFGAATPTAALIAVLPAVLTGLAYGAPVTAFAGWLENETGLSSMFRFAIVPMFLFSGTFFPISQLPDWLQPAAYVVPLWHGVQLTRAVTLGWDTVLAPWLHVTYLGAWVAAGTWLAVRVFHRRLVR
jgi:lipooligosaccharide transport system permease protein